MCGGDEVPERPTRKDSDDPDCVLFVTGGYSRLFLCVFGLPFTFGGLLALVTTVREFQGSLVTAGVVSLLALGIAHTSVGCGILWVAFCSSEWIRFDRLHGLVTKRTGIRGLHRFSKASLSDFSEVSILPVANKWQSRDDFDIALTGPDYKHFPIGRVTLSYGLAREFGQEVATFLGLPLH